MTSAPDTDTGASVPAPLGSDASMELGWALDVLGREYRGRLSALMSDLPHGQRGHQVLLALARGDHRSQAALAQYLGIDRTVMTYLLDDLEAADMVVRRADPADRRRRVVDLTTAGRDHLARRCAEVGRIERALFPGMSDAERARLCAQLVAGAHALTGTAPTVDACLRAADGG